MKKKKKDELESREDVKGFVLWAIENDVYKHERETDFSAASLTSTSFSPNQKAITSFRALKAPEIREKIYEVVKKGKMKAYVQIITNLGAMDFVVHSNIVCKTS